MPQRDLYRNTLHPAGSQEGLPAVSAGALSRILDLVDDAIISVDSEQRIVVYNQAAERVFGYAAREIAGKPLNLLLPYRSVRAQGAPVVEFGPLPQGLRPVPEHQEILACRRNGEEFQTEVLVRKFPVEDGSISTLILRDVTRWSKAGESSRQDSFRGCLQPGRDEPCPQNLIASSESIRQVLMFAKRAAASEAPTILIEGESGVGKDVLARFIHDHSPRRSKAFLAINCAAIPETLLESELFGYEKGAFTDARNQKPGILEVASGGTVLLDEIGELPLSLQAKLLRVVEEQQFRRLGGTKDLRVDLRVITATNRDLKEAIRQRMFRLDLYYRLNAIQTTIPPLRDRKDDIVPLAQYFVALYNRRFGRAVKGLAADAVSALLVHTWPGNVRELRNAIERAMLMYDGDWIRATDLGIIDCAPLFAATGHEPSADPSLAEVERIMLVRALTKASWNQTQASHLLNITRDTLRYKMKKFKLMHPPVDAVL